MCLAGHIGLDHAHRRPEAVSHSRSIVAASVAYHHYIQLAGFRAVGYRLQRPGDHRNLIVRGNDYGNHSDQRTAVALANTLIPSPTLP